MSSHKMEKHTSKYKQPWFIRRVVYIIVAIAALVANYFFDIPVAQTNAWYPTVESIINFVAPLFLFYAATKANPGSDANVTEDDLTQSQLDVIEARQRVEGAKKTETRIDDVASRVNLGLVSITNLIEEIRENNNGSPGSSNQNFEEKPEASYMGPVDSTPPVELSLESLRERLSEHN